MTVFHYNNSKLEVLCDKTSSASQIGQFLREWLLLPKFLCLKSAERFVVNIIGHFF